MKTRKPLWKVSVATTLEAEEAIAEVLGEIFHCPVSSFFDLEKKTNRVTVFLQARVQSQSLTELRQGLSRIEDCGLDTGPGKISVVKVRREDWAESWKRHFKPIEIRGKLLVKPSWSKKRPRTGQATVILDPGLSFGTGQHPTTAFCLEEIVKYSGRRSGKNGRSFLDVGTGSSILAIAAAKLGYTRVRAFDFDPEAVRVARANARVNRVLNKIEITHSDVAKLPIRPKERSDVICANLISDLLVRERKRIIGQMNPGGVLVLAGILKKEFSEVRRAYEKSGLKLISTRRKKEWQSGSFCFE
jgi:ribosomal protein L11 methyltransferase